MIIQATKATIVAQCIEYKNQQLHKSTTKQINNIPKTNYHVKATNYHVVCVYYHS